MFQPISIEKSSFTLCSQYNLASVFQKPFYEALFFVFSPANFALLTNCAQEKDYAVWNGREQEKRRRLASAGGSYHPF